MIIKIIQVIIIIIIIIIILYTNTCRCCRGDSVALTLLSAYRKEKQFGANFAEKSDKHLKCSKAVLLSPPRFRGN
jgi:hypothetical protein